MVLCWGCGDVAAASVFLHGSPMGGRRLVMEPSHGLMIQKPACHQLCTASLLGRQHTSRRKVLTLLVALTPGTRRW